MNSRALLYLTLSFLAGCFPPTAERSASTPRPVLTISYRSLISGLDPIKENTVISNSIYSNIYEPLVVRDDNLKIVPALALDWLNPDDRTWILKLRPHVRFHDGSEVHAEDVCFSVERARNDPGSQLSGSLTMLERIEAMDDRTVKIVTKQPYSILLSRLVDIWIVPKKFFSTMRFSGDLIPGTGPYRVLKWSPGQFIELIAFEGYRQGKPAVDHGFFRALPDLNARLKGLAEKRIDILPLLEPNAFSKPFLNDRSRFQIRSTPGLAVLLLVMDQKREKTPYVDVPQNPFRDIRVRKAIYHAINIRHIINDLLRGHAIEATQAVAPKVFGYNAQIKRLDYDPVEAKRLLKEAGYADGFRARLDITNNRYRRDLEIGKSIAADLQSVGIHVMVNAMSVENLTALREKGDSSFSMIGWSLPSTDASGALDYLLHTPDPSRGYGSQNTGGYSNPEVDRLAEESSATMEPNTRAALMEEAMRLCMQDVAVVPLHVENNLSVYLTRVRWEPRADEYIYLKNISLSK